MADGSPEIENGIIESADIRFDREIFLSAWLSLSFDGAGQGFGGYSLGGSPFDTAKCADHINQKNIAADFIGGIMAVADVNNWSDLKGKIIRVERESGLITAIGHPVKDRWYRPKERMAMLTERSA